MSDETRVGESANDRYERLAVEFYRETGMMAPGKDDPICHHTYADRWTAWEAWTHRRAALAAQEETP